MPDLKRAILVGTAALVMATSPLAAQEQQKPNILVIWGDDIGTWNISHNNRGMMGYETPNIDRIAAEGLSFTDYYGQQSCTAGRAAFVFALSCVLGAAIARTLLQGGLSAAAYGQLMAAWLVVVMILFGIPLLAFSGPLRQLKEATVLAASSVATRRERAVERELLGSNMSVAGEANATASGEIPDPSKLYAAAKKLSTFLISRAALVPIAAAALLPLVAAGATQLPVRELLKMARSLLLL